MTASDVVELLDVVERTGGTVWLDGGWGVDALLGEQTREHDDLDVAVEESDHARVAQALRERGFRPVFRGDTSDWNYALGDDRGREVDLDVFRAGDTGAGWYGPPGEQVATYTTHALGGRGQILGRHVPCIAPDVLVTLHTGYAVDENDWHDVSLLCERFGLGVPPDYDTFRPGRPRGLDRVSVAPGDPIPDAVRSLLRLLPDWFGIESAVEGYVDDAGRMQTVAARDDAEHIVAVLLLAEHDPGCPEVHLMAVHPVWHRRGVGSALLRTAEHLARSAGEGLLSVKTLGPSRPHAGYDRTRAFYLGAGFLPVEEFLDLWPGNPALVLVKPL